MNRSVDPKDITLVAVANRKPTAPYHSAKATAASASGQTPQAAKPRRGRGTEK